jgi:HSP20 family protein
MNATLSKTEPQRPTNGNAAGGNRVSYLTPLANIVESSDGYLLQAEMPGVTKEGLEITVENGELVIFGRRHATETRGREVYRESRGLDYRRVFELDPSIDTSKIVAKIEQGVLQLTLPKAESVKPRTIQVTD